MVYPTAFVSIARLLDPIVSDGERGVDDVWALFHAVLVVQSEQIGDLYVDMDEYFQVERSDVYSW